MRHLKIRYRIKLIREGENMDDNKEEEKIDVQEETEKYIIRNMESSLERPKYSAKRDRAKYDDLTKRKQFRDAQFGDKQTIKDPYTGETLHKSTKAAQNKYGKIVLIIILLKQIIQSLLKLYMIKLEIMFL